MGNNQISGVIAYENGIELIEKFMERLKEIDPSMTQIKIITKGKFSREIIKDYVVIDK